MPRSSLFGNGKDAKHYSVTYPGFLSRKTEKIPTREIDVKRKIVFDKLVHKKSIVPRHRNGETRPMPPDKSTVRFK